MVIADGGKGGACSTIISYMFSKNLTKIRRNEAKFFQEFKLFSYKSDMYCIFEKAVMIFPGG